MWVAPNTPRVFLGEGTPLNQRSGPIVGFYALAYGYSLGGDAEQAWCPRYRRIWAAVSAEDFAKTEVDGGHRR